MLKRQSRCYALVLSLTWVGCGQAPPAVPPATPTTHVEPVVKLTPTPEASSAISPVAESELPTPTQSAANLAPQIPEAAYLSDDVVGLVVVHHKRLHETPIYRMLREAGLEDEFEQQFNPLMIKPESVERAMLVIDKTFVRQTAVASFIDLSAQPLVSDQSPETIAGEMSVAAVRDNLKDIGLAFYKYHGEHSSLPRADGNADGSQTGLSWRVHLLPLLYQSDLYEQFHLDEPWDSEHNKTLIEKMPAVFNSPGLTEKGKTTMHVFTGETTPFNGEKGLTLSAVKDGITNTILAVMAGPDTAEPWTKPGGLKFDVSMPKKALGSVSKKILALLADGSVQKISLKMDDSEFAKLVEIADGNPVNGQQAFESADLDQVPVPTWIFTLASEIDKRATIELAVNGAEEESYEGLILHQNDTVAICFVDDRTVLRARPATLRKMIDGRKAGRSSILPLLSQLPSNADFAWAVDLQSQSTLIDQAARTNPLIGMLQQIKSASLQANLTEKAGGKLLELVAYAVNEQAAGALSQLADGELTQLKASLSDAPVPPDPAEARKLEFARTLGESSIIKQIGSRIELLIPVPEGFDEFPEILTPALNKAAPDTEKQTQEK